jgi:3'-phosphoadenosine 5'-phosphosulfate sulfotransferase (PAPS reductase)/FAD synthetase
VSLALLEQPRNCAALPPIALSREIEDAIRTGAWLVFNLSGGKDSTVSLFAAMLHLDTVGHPRERRLAVHADLGRAEWDATPAMVERIAALAGVPLLVVRRQAGDLIARWEQRFENGKARYEALSTYNLIGPWSSASLRFCTSEHKAQVIGPELARRLRGATIVNVIGIRRDESSSRARTPVSKADERFAKPGNAAGTAMLVWHPIVAWSEAQVFGAHGMLGLPLHEAYTRYGSPRLSCWYCVLSSLDGLTASASAPGNAEIYRHLVALEARSTFSFQPARWLADVAPHLLSPGLIADIERARVEAAQRRQLEAALPKGLRYIKGWPPRAPSLPEAAQIATARTAILARHGLADRFPTPSAVLGRFEELLAAKAARRPATRIDAPC